jgi:hypothetical protein
MSPPAEIASALRPPQWQYPLSLRAKRSKRGSRQKKIDLINSMNPQWRDLYDDL